MNIKRRISALEAGNASGISAASRAWLGWPISDAERQTLETEVPAAIDTTSWSAEARAWWCAR